jgi:hypothetical protein
LFTIRFIAVPGGPPIDQATSTTATLEEAIQNAQELLQNTTIAGQQRSASEIAYMIEDEAGKYLGTWINAIRVDF